MKSHLIERIQITHEVSNDENQQNSRTYWGGGFIVEIKENTILTVRSIIQFTYEELLKSLTCSMHILYVSDT